MLEQLKRLSQMSNASPQLVAFIHQESVKPTMVDPVYAEAYVAAALSSAGIPVEHKAELIYGESNYEGSTPLSVSRIGSTAILDISGGLVTRHEAGLCGAQASYEGIIATMDVLMDDPDVDTIVGRFKSGGGLVAGMVHASKHIASLRGKGKRLYGLADTHALSAAYGLISAFDEVWVNHGCALGSIGVFLRHTSVADLNKSKGVDVTYVYAGDFKVAGNPDEKLDSVTRARLQNSVDADYAEFTQLVAKNRGMSVEAVVNTQAQWYTSGNVELGLADKVGSFIELLNHIESNTMTEEQIAKLKADAKVEARAELEMEARLSDEAASNAKAKADAQAELDAKAVAKVAEATRVASITSMCAVSGLDSSATDTFIASGKSADDVQSSLIALSKADSISLNPASSGGNGASTLDPWANVNWK